MSESWSRGTLKIAPDVSITPEIMDHVFFIADYFAIFQFGLDNLDTSITRHWGFYWVGRSNSTNIIRIIYHLSFIARFH